MRYIRWLNIMNASRWIEMNLVGKIEAGSWNRTEFLVYAQLNPSNTNRTVIGWKPLVQRHLQLFDRAFPRKQNEPSLPASPRPKSYVSLTPRILFWLGILLIHLQGFVYGFALPSWVRGMQKYSQFCQLQQVMNVSVVQQCHDLYREFWT